MKKNLIFSIVCSLLLMWGCSKDDSASSSTIQDNLQRGNIVKATHWIEGKSSAYSPEYISYDHAGRVTEYGDYKFFYNDNTLRITEYGYDWINAKTNSNGYVVEMVEKPYGEPRSYQYTFSYDSSGRIKSYTCKWTRTTTIGNFTWENGNLVAINETESDIEEGTSTSKTQIRYKDVECNMNIDLVGLFELTSYKAYSLTVLAQIGFLGRFSIDIPESSYQVYTYAGGDYQESYSEQYDYEIDNEGKIVGIRFADAPNCGWDILYE